MVTLDHETALWNAGARVLVGMDEVGRGALAGPVSVGAVALKRCGTWPAGLADSKALTPATREGLIGAIGAFCLASAVGHATAAEIDEVGIVCALRLAGLRALATLGVNGIAVDAVLLDGTHDWITSPPVDLFGDDADHRAADAPPVTLVVKGDTHCASIAAASVIAKVERDALMREAHRTHPHYAWESNKGYGAEVHLAALRAHGPSPLHRISWRLPALNTPDASGLVPAAAQDRQ